jgi:hypothetical protein
VAADSAGVRSRTLRYLGSVPGAVVAAGAVGFVLLLLRGASGRFFFDAQMYWLGADAFLSLDNFYLEGGLGIRGALSAVVYTPAALFARVFGEDASGVGVLIENSLLIVAIGALIVPWIVSRLVPVGARHIWISMAVSVLFLGGFAPYPLMDLWATALLLVGIALLTRRRWWSVALAGLTLGAAVNLRPAHLVPVVLVVAVWLVYRWRSSLFAVAGIALAFVPQLVVNRYFGGAWSPFPLQTFLITDIQAQYASFTVRYDTVPFAGTDPRLFFCSPDYASDVVSAIPSSSGELAVSYLQNLPSALLFMSQKVAAALHWSFLTPYSEPAGGFSVLTPLVIGVSAVGILALVRAAVSSSSMKRSPLLAMLFALWIGCLATLVVSAPESRFALPVVLVDLVGALVIVPRAKAPGLSRLRDRGVWPWAIGAVALSVLLLVLGLSGLAHPAAAGDATAAICAAR